MKKRPSDDPALCGQCHDEIAGNFKKSLHYTDRGIQTRGIAEILQGGSRDLRREGLPDGLQQLSRLLRGLPPEEPGDQRRERRAPPAPPLREARRGEDVRPVPRRAGVPRVHGRVRGHAGRPLPEGHDLPRLPQQVRVSRGRDAPGVETRAEGAPLLRQVPSGRAGEVRKGEDRPRPARDEVELHRLPLRGALPELLQLPPRKGRGGQAGVHPRAESPRPEDGDHAAGHPDGEGHLRFRRDPYGEVRRAPQLLGHRPPQHQEAHRPDPILRLLPRGEGAVPEKGGAAPRGIQGERRTHRCSKIYSSRRSL